MPATIDEAVVDTSLLRSQATRRFLAAWWELRGAKLLLTPEIVIELRRQLPKATFTDWTRRLEQEDPAGKRYPAAKRLRIVNAAKRAAVQWLHEELLNRNGLYVTRQLTQIEEVEAFRIESTLDAHPEVSYDDHDKTAGDRKIIAEVRAMGRRVVITNNHNSLRPKHVRECLEAIGAGHGSALQGGAKALDGLEGNSHYDALALHSAVVAVWPDAPTKPEKGAVILRKHWKAITEGGLRDVAAGGSKVWDRLVATEEITTWLAEVVPTLGGSAARRNQSAKHADERQAARSEGWMGGRGTTQAEGPDAIIPRPL